VAARAASVDITAKRRCFFIFEAPRSKRQIEAFLRLYQGILSFNGAEVKRVSGDLVALAFGSGF
jgi:hypothetical protein